MKKHVLKLVVITLIILAQSSALASNIRIPKKPEITSVTSTERVITFSLSWDYSWRALDPNNWDAAWIFVKYRIGSRDWDHMYLDASYAPTVGNNNGVSHTYKYGTTDGKAVGVFLYRAGMGRGDITWDEVTLRWKYTDDKYLSTTTVSQTDEITIKVFAIEMVYIPEGAFYLGSGGTEAGHFRKTEEDGPYFVENEAAITVGAFGSVGGLTALSNNYAANVAAGMGPQGVDAIPADFPKGFNAFYCMKYEISQEAYVDFLNTISTTQQTSRINVGTPNSVAGTRVFYMTNTSDRNYIKITKQGIAEYGCDLNNNGIPNEDADGQNIACAMRHQDLLAYLDFSGLRPMTEMEYEKACRGTLEPVPLEFAWGSTYYLLGNAFLAGTAGTPDETPSVNYVNILGTGQGLVARNGVFANDTSGRTVSGATYYGIMEMSGNLWELTVAANQASGRLYTGNHGDGKLTSGGSHDVTSWPDYLGMGIRGGSAAEAPTTTSHRISDRSNAFWNSAAGASWNVGGRGVRTAE